MEQISGIVDAHAHSDRKLTWQHTPEQLLSMMKESGIVRTVLTSYWDLPSEADPEATIRFESVLKRHKEFIGFLRLNPNEARSETLLARMANEKLIFGLKLNPMTNAVAPYSANTLKLVAVAAGLGLPVLFHTGTIPFRIRSKLKELPKRVRRPLSFWVTWEDFSMLRKRSVSLRETGMFTSKLQSCRIHHSFKMP